jgi:hypothetical protein
MRITKVLPRGVDLGTFEPLTRRMTSRTQPRRSAAKRSNQPARVQVAKVATQQFGRISRAQLALLGVGDSTISGWTGAGYLFRRLPGVYAVGHPGRSVGSDLSEAVLFAGPGAMLSHRTAAWWSGLIDRPSPLIHVSTPRRRYAPAGIVIHDRRPLPRAEHRGLPVTEPDQTVFDLAAGCVDEPVLVRVALAELDFQDRYDPWALLALCRRGAPGSAALRWAIAHFDPRFAETRSRYERDWIVYCERTGTPKPDAVNRHIHGIRSDNVYFGARLIVELDGVDNHHSPAQIRRDRRNDRILRGYGWLVLRYAWPDVEQDPLGVHTDVVAALDARTE